MVQAGVGVAVLARWAVAPYIETRKVSAIPLKRPGLRRVWQAVRLETPTAPAYLAEFIDRLARHCRP